MTNQTTTDTPDEMLAYFAPLLPWQKAAWQQFITQCREAHLPHGLLAAGLSGIGKRAFVWRMVAYLLCEHHAHDAACGQCESCHWLKSGTHPDLLVLPAAAIPAAEYSDEASARTGTDKVSADTSSIKIADIRALQDYVQTKGRGAKVIVLDGAENMTMGAANALLKTLEEPRDGVYLILMTDHPARLVPTIRSRLQRLPLTQIDHEVALDYLMAAGLGSDEAAHALRLTDGAVLHAATLTQKPWYQARSAWLKTLLALSAGHRTAVQASDYWQGELPLADFITLSRLMLSDIWRVGLGLPSLHEDIGMVDLLGDPIAISPAVLDNLQAVLDDIDTSTEQNVQEKMAYDRLMAAMALA